MPTEINCQKLFMWKDCYNELEWTTESLNIVNVKCNMLTLSKLAVLINQFQWPIKIIEKHLMEKSFKEILNNRPKIIDIML